MSPGRIRLTPQQTDAVNNVRRILSDLTYELDKMDKCGIDCQQERAEQQRLAAGLSNIITYFGHQGP